MMRPVTLALAFALAFALAAWSIAATAESRSRELRLAREADRFLVGTLLAPDKVSIREPVLVVPGSGPTDRDGNNPLGVSAATYRLLAEGLAAQGVASLRTDKRGIAASRAALAREEDSTIQSSADDTRAWARQLRATAGSRCVWLLGHSEGATVALLAATDSEHVCGVVLVSGLGRPAADVLREQLRANPANQPILDDAFKALAEMEAGRHVDVSAMHPALLALFRPSVQPHLISLFALDPVLLLRTYPGPVLVMQGTTDLQTSVQDAQNLAGARAGVELALLEGVNHVLKSAAAERAANLTTYRNPSLPLAPGIVERIVTFLRQHGPDGNR